NDEDARRVKPPADFPDHSTALISYMEGLALQHENGGVDDAQPDIFSFNFNGHNGRFILDSNMVTARHLTHSNMKIEVDLNSTDWNFKLTDSDGVQYYFGGSSTTEITSNSSAGLGCGKTYFNAVATAFYLKKIVHPNNDVVNFSYATNGYIYKTGTIETMYARDPTAYEICGNGSSTGPPNFNNTTCLSILTVAGKLLQEITSTSGTRVKFDYISRSDINDQLLSKIELFPPGSGTPVKVFSLLYEKAVAVSFLNPYSQSDTSLKYRYFLSKLVERSPDSSITKTHQFSYNDINGLPPRLSFAQDDYGIFNGKNNTTLIPKPSYFSWQTKLTAATANREVDANYGIKGLLNKITYPTGGTDTIQYESNTIYTTIALPRPDSLVFAEARTGELGGGPSTQVKYSNTAYIQDLQPGDPSIVINSSTTYMGPSGEYDPLHCDGIVQVIDAGTGSIVYTKNIDCQDGPAADELFLLEGHSYFIKVTAGGHKVSTVAGFSYKYGLQQYATFNKAVGGLRVAKVITHDPTASKLMTKKYIYANLATQDRSSGGIIYQPVYDKYLTAYVSCANGGGLPSCDFAKYFYYTMFSHSQNNIYAYTGAPVSYSSVIESLGENFENGGIEHQYKVAPDQQGAIYLGNNILGAPLSSYSWENGREFYQHSFRKQESNYIAVKKTYTHYKDDARVDTIWNSYIVNKKYNPVCQANPPVITQIEAYDLFQYRLFRKWSYVDTIRTLTYDNPGQNYVEQTTVTEYANVNHALPTKIITKKSNQATQNINNYYPQDLILSGAEETARQAMVARHIIAPILQTQVTQNAAQVFKAISNYKVFPNGLVLPHTQYVQTAAYPSEKRVEFFRYNNVGKLYEQSKANDVKTNYLWDYNALYPIAEVKNADSANIAYTSFESDGKGNWTFSGSPATDATSPTGKKVYVLTAGNTSKSGLNASITYTVSYWSKNGAQMVSGSSVTTTGKSANGWIYYEHKVVNPIAGTITVSGNGAIDELRLYPVNALMSSYTYDPIIGITSQCDANNNIAYYEYDSFNRLTVVRDQDKNIVKKICYNYGGQPQNCSGLYTNIEMSQSFTRNNCGTGIGTSVIYTVPEGKYTTTGPTAANQLAQDEINANGQAHANANGTCGWYNVAKSGTFVRNNCGAGYTGSQVIYTVAANTYFSAVSPEAADQLAQNDVNANGQAYANANGTCSSNCNTSNCNAVNKKCVNGVCETGVKVYTDSIEKPDGSYICYYHYEWSDGSWSQSYSQTRPVGSPCPGL
ncbi:MAG TPA: DUF5977 domain-containing protein, partial [Chitinophagaceae bacterium]|nr:DUF5977 domain-containing protein [Chitinophagaceae bacterium]